VRSREAKDTRAEGGGWHAGLLEIVGYLLDGVMPSFSVVSGGVSGGAWADSVRSPPEDGSYTGEARQGFIVLGWVGRRQTLWPGSYTPKVAKVHCSQTFGSLHGEWAGVPTNLPEV
jgi:hypothetical protein